jgi:hypothetical protein
MHEHPDSSLGDAIDVFRTEHLTRIDLEHWRPSPPQPGVDIGPRYLSEL